MYLLFLFVYLFFSFSYSNYVVDEKKLHLLKLIMVMNCLVVFSYKGFLENFAGNLSRSGNTPIWWNAAIVVHGIGEIYFI